MRNIANLIIKIVRHPLETALCTLLLAMTAVVFSQVIARYVLQAPLSWSEELARFLLMWLSMLSAAYAFKTKSHFALRFLVGKLSAAQQRRVELLVYVLVALFFAALLYFSIVFLIGVKGHTAPALQISMQIPYASIAAGCALILFDSVRALWRMLTPRAAGANSQF